MPRHQLHEKRPANGIARKLWDWATRNQLFDKPAGVEPLSLFVAHPTPAQATKGAGRYFLTPISPKEIVFYEASEIRDVLKAPSFTLEHHYRLPTLYYAIPTKEQPYERTLQH